MKGTEESARLNIVLAIADLLTQIALVAIGLVLVFNPDLLVRQVDLGTAPSWGDFALGIAVGMVAYTGIETISNMAEEARDASRTIPRGTGLVVAAVVGLYALLPAIALSAMPVTRRTADGDYTTELGTTFADDPVLGIVENIGLSPGLTDALAVYVGILAAVILLIATNAGLIGRLAADVLDGPAPPAPRAPAPGPPAVQDPVHRDHRLLRRRRDRDGPRRDGLPRRRSTPSAPPRRSPSPTLPLIRLRRLRPLASRPAGTDGEPMWHSPGTLRVRVWTCP